MGAAEILSDQLGLYSSYDLGIHRWIQGIVTKTEPTTVVIQSSPMRAFGDAAAMLEKGLIDSGVLPDGDFNRSANIPLPLVSVHPSAPEKREWGRITPFRNLFRDSLPGTGTDMRNRYTAKPPTPYWITYSIDIWTKTRSTMNALVSDILREFDPYMTYGEAVIDTDFWGTILMPIHNQGITDNSELEAGANDRLLRHTLTVRVEAWLFYAPETAKVMLYPVIDDAGTMQLSGLKYVDPMRFPAIYLEGPAGRWYAFSMTNYGRVGIVPVENVTNAVTLYFGFKTVIFKDGLFLNETHRDGTVDCYNLTFRDLGSGYGEKIVTQRTQTLLPLVDPLVIPKGQNLYIGNGGNFFAEIRLSNQFKPLYQLRALLGTNVPPPYATPFDPPLTPII